MKTVPITIEHMTPTWVEQDLLRWVGEVAGECYNSSKDDDACIKRAMNCIKRGHHSPWEHVNITLRCTVDRGVSHALVRHRHCAFQQSSTIYQKFNDLVFIEPNSLDEDTANQIQARYQECLAQGMKPAEARDVLPNCLATNLIITTNIRQWMYMIHRRCGPGDSENMHEWCRKVREWFHEQYPTIVDLFDTWYVNHPI